MKPLLKYSEETVIKEKALGWRTCVKAGAPSFCSQPQPIVAFRSKNKLLYYILVYAMINAESGFNIFYEVKL